MTGGTILVEGSAGLEIGMRMKRGLDRRRRAGAGTSPACR